MSRFTTWATLLVTAFLGWSQSNSIAAEPDQSGYYRYPDVRGDRIVFTSEGDLWTVSLKDGGDAMRLTRDDGLETYARISPDGKWIAFSGQYGGNTDVYVIPSTGGTPERLTYHSAWDEVVGWSDDSKSVLFRSFRYSPNMTWKVYSVNINGGVPEDIGLDKAARVSYEPGGKRLAFTRLRSEKTSWKGYKGGQAMDIWIGNLKNMEFKKLTDWDGTDAYPMWFGDRIYFLSDRSGRGNLFSMKPDGSDIKQLTYENEWDVRCPSGDGKTIVYQGQMDVWAFDIASGKSHRLNITLPSDRIRKQERIVNPRGYIDGYSIPDNGKRLAVAARGEVFTFPVEKKGYIRQLSHTPGAREKFVAYSPDGKQVAVLSDASGEEEIWLYPSDGKGEPQQLTKGGDRTRYWISWSPDSKQILFEDKSNRLWLVDAEKGRQTLVYEAPELWGADWSPDSKWIAFIAVNDSYESDIYLYNIAEKTTRQIELPVTSESDVTWDPSGKYLYFISDSWFNPLQGNGAFIADKSDKMYMILLTDKVENPFSHKLVEAFNRDDEENKDDEEVDKKDSDDEVKGNDDDDKDDEKENIDVQLDELENRVVMVPIDAGNYFGLVATSGRIYYGSWEQLGMWSDGNGPDGFPLHTFNIEKEKSEIVDASINNYSFSTDREKILVIKRGSVIVMDAGATSLPSEDGYVDMSGWSMEVDPQAEWRQILREVWRLERDFFYDPNMHGVNWNKMWDKYSPLLPRISDREELVDFTREMLGELNVSHAYMSDGDIREARSVGIGGLGADLEPTGSGPYLVRRILHGDGWGDEPVSPLAHPADSVKEGEYIVAIDGIPLEKGDNINKRFVDKAGKSILISVNGEPDLKGARDIEIETMDDEDYLRYLDWVRDRREFVDSISGGKAGYIHIPDMGSQGLSMFGRMYYHQNQKKALVIDVRYNGGGSVANMILSVLGEKVWARGVAREGLAFNRPYQAFWGPLVAVCNHETGSDGETFSEGFKRLGLGELVGTRTWGGWVGIHGFNALVDRGYNSIPTSSGWGIDDGQWMIEGPGVSPTIEIEDDPAKMILGEDPQLEAAVNNVMEKLKDWPEPPGPPPYPVRPIKLRNVK